ncbi:MAG: hypothetical protein ABI912_02100 [Actinomycetota bacterium]
MGRCRIDDRQIDSLYRLTPEDFVSARDSLARALRSAGDKEMSAQVKALRRPSVAAWLVNQLARERDDELDELLATGAVLRATQAAVLSGRADGAQLQALTAGRREQIDALLAAARDLAAQADRKNAPLDAVDATLIAATADESAAAAVRSGRLVKELSYSGFGLSDDIAEAVAPALRVVPRQARTAPPAKSARPTKAERSHTTSNKPAAEPRRDPAAERRAAAEAAATAAVRQAQQAVNDALGAADDAQRAFDTLTRDVDRAAADEQRLAGELAAIREQLADSKERQRVARGVARSAHADAERARTVLVKAQQKLDHLR